MSTKLVHAIRQQDWHEANQTFALVMQQKLADRLATERQTISETLVREAKMTWWRVMLNGKEIDKIQYTSDMSADDVKKSLVDHDGYDAGIKVIKESKDPTDHKFVPGSTGWGKLETRPNPPRYCKECGATEAEHTVKEASQYIDSKCDKCDKVASWRARDPKTGDLVAAACAEHKDEVRNDALAKAKAKRGLKEAKTKTTPHICHIPGNDKPCPACAGRKDIKEDMSVAEVQRVYDEVGIASEVEILCGVKNLHVNDRGQVLSYVIEDSIGQQNSDYEKAVDTLEKNIRTYIASAKKDGTMGMSKRNLQQVVKTTGVSLNNQNAFQRAFSDACDRVGLMKGFVIYEDAKPKVEVKKGRAGKWDIFVNGELVEGGFFSRDAADKAAEEYVTYEHHPPIKEATYRVTHPDKNPVTIHDAEDEYDAKKQAAKLWGLPDGPNTGASYVLSAAGSKMTATLVKEASDLGKCVHCGGDASSKNSVGDYECHNCETRLNAQGTQRKSMKEWSDDPDNDPSDDRSNFRDPGGKSALRAGKRIYPCPTCGAKNALTAKDKLLGYQCDRCADRDEGGGY